MYDVLFQIYDLTVSSNRSLNNDYFYSVICY